MLKSYLETPKYHKNGSKYFYRIGELLEYESGVREVLMYEDPNKYIKVGEPQQVNIPSEENLGGYMAGGKWIAGKKY